MFTPLREIIKTTLRNPGVTKQAQANRISSCFRLLVTQRFGQAVADRVGHISYQQSVLLVTATSPLVIQELRLQLPYWLEGLEKQCGKGVVNAVRFYVGS